MFPLRETLVTHSDPHSSLGICIWDVLEETHVSGEFERRDRAYKAQPILHPLLGSA